MQLITGNTYPVKDAIKALGGKWNKPRQGWEVPDDKAEEARTLVANAPEKAGRFESVGAYSRRRSRRSYRSNYVSNVTRFSSGAVVYVNKGGRCEDAPCCGCCS